MTHLTQASSHSADEAGTQITFEPALHAAELGGQADEWVQLLPPSPFVGRDGRGPYVYDAAEVVEQTREYSGGADLPIDYGHALEVDGPSGDAAPAAGWISELEARKDGLWGRVNWTEEGARRVTGREYRFLSPVFAHPKEGEKRVLWLMRAGLTNRPNLIMRAVNAQNQESGMKELLQRIAAAVGLAADADEAAIVAKCSSLRTAEGTLTAVAQSAEVAATSTAAEIVTATQAKATPDPAKFVPIDQFKTVSTALQAARQREGEALVDQLQEAGKLAPAQRDWALAYHSKDPEAFKAFASTLPVVLKAGAEAKGGAPEKGKKLDEAALAVCSMLNIEQADYTKNLEAA